MKYESPSLEMTELETKDVITTSVQNNGNGSITVDDKTISGQEGTFSGLFDELL